VSEQGLPFDSPYQSFEYMAEMRKYFGEKIAQEIEALHEKCFSFSDCQCLEAAAIARGTNA